MARPAFINKIFRLVGVDQIDQIPTENTDKSYRSMSDSDMKKFVGDTFVKNPNAINRIDHLQIPSMLEPISRELLDRKSDHTKLNMLAPEIEQAASILIPSILTPNDFRKNIFSISIESENESDEILAEVVDLITEHFGNNLDLTTKLSKWVDEAMFKAGSKSILLLPTKTIGNIKNAYGSTESLQNIMILTAQISGSIESINLKVDDSITDKCVDSIVNCFTYIESDSTKNEIPSSSNLATSLKSYIPNLINKFDKDNLLGFTIDPRILINSSLENIGAVESIDRNILASLGESTPKYLRSDNESKSEVDDKNAIYYYAPYVDLSNFIKDGDTISYPAMLELPSESVIPVTIEGAPDNHIGYFVILNENGTPITWDTSPLSEVTETVSGSQRINNLYSSFYGSQYYSIQKRMSMDAKTEILNSIYDNYLHGIMESKLKTIGINKANINMVSDLSRVMFSRLLKSTKTRILYVPKKLMLYLAFDYHPDGTGKSKIDNIKFPLSLKITLIIVRLISLIESSINRRKLNITLDDTIGNPLEVLRTIKKELMKNKMYGISYDPSTIIKSVLDKELTVVPNKIPGVEEFSLTDENNNVDYPRPDDAILEEINNMYMLSLGVPPSAMNRLSEDEFSRSVASNNIFFSNQLKTYQNVICKFMTDLIKTYIGFSSKLQDNIKDIVAKSLSDDSDKKMSVNNRIRDIIENIKFTLPSPNLSQDKSSFDDLREYIEIVDTVVEKLFPDDMTYDGDLANVIRVLRWRTRFDILQNHISTNSVLSDINFDGLADPNITGIITDTQKLRNIKAAIDTLLAKLGNPEEEESSYSSPSPTESEEASPEEGGEFETSNW